MSFFDHHHYSQPGYDRFATYPAFYHQAPPVNTFATPYPSFATQSDYYSIEEEERAALAHLQTIQRRRQAMEAAQAREAAAIRAHAQARREAAIRAEVARQVAREQALHARRLEEERRKRAYLKLIEKREAKARALKEAQYLHELQDQRERAIGCPKRCCRTVTSHQSPAIPVFDEINALFGALLGIPVEDSDGDSEVNSCCKSQPVPVACSSQPKVESESEPKTQPKPEIKPEPKQEIKSKPTSASTTKSATASTSSSEEASLDLNKLLNQFLGLQIEPLSSDVPTSTASKSSKVPEGLNEFLAQFGLVFEPEEHAVERSCEGTNTDTCTDKCQCNGSDSFQDLCKKKKGKQVAEEEKKPAPASTTGNAPTTAATDNAVAPPDPSTSLSALQDIERQLAALQSGFTFPERLSFAHSVPGTHAPPLLFNRLNSPYHAQTNALLQLLLQADSIASNGESQVRRKRKELVKKVEDEIQKLEQQRDEKWEEVRERRLNGEESEPENDDRSWSESSSESGKDVLDHEEVLVNRHAAGPTARVVSAFDESTAATPVVPQSSESSASVVEEALKTPANTSEEVPSTLAVEQEQEGSSDNLAATTQSQSPAGPQPGDVPISTAISPVHHPVTLEDAEEEDDKKEGNKKEKQEAKDEGYEII
ncbi:hypothetical protein I307_00144 [Cryptococcus deuterogattii 99/473]|uniref:BAG domain-containing protein n=1 Tax=Cryptococcus deuterogattii Ram5 TaxID=1296110 RepID=A0A0D0VBH8_9TREE|nr:hypothetical protein I309_00935 [Cryptococcus deuterogattii LA55]KIR43814.1 hypothetical protein I313_00659 [Cryptococcus deuterogattii Ram5]KIR92815.1 hypothetical protein I304_03395 [Cryptococcus deuterogattii CBS 10090]KIY60344.1 hypothetical protein I307_00144 [Cryptococcus deuterogattii 99/473]